MSALNDIPTYDLNLFLHELRMRRLALMPAEARVVLSGGAANEVYFDWFSENYPGRVERHIAVEYFQPPPDPLPEGVEWLARTLGDVSPVRDGEVDLVFAGQVIEHLWPDDIAGFLSEAHRVLRPGGAVVIDSPTRFITEGLAWTQPGHTIELEVDEIVELLTLAGFVDIDVKGYGSATTASTRRCCRLRYSPVETTGLGGPGRRSRRPSPRVLHLVG